MKIARMIVASATLVPIAGLGAIGAFLPARALTQQELEAKLASSGYSQIRDVKPTAKGTALKATKNGKEVPLVVDSSGQIQERR